MEKFGENYRAGRGPVSCPLCSNHLDNLEMAFQCPVIIKEQTIKGKPEDIYKENIKLETVETIVKIVELRKQKLEDN